MADLEQVDRAIIVLRGRRVILDSELAALYGVTVSRLAEQSIRDWLAATPRKTSSV